MKSVHYPEAYSQPYQTCKMKVLEKTVNRYKSPTIYTKSFTLGVWWGSEYARFQLFQRRKVSFRYFWLVFSEAAYWSSIWGIALSKATWGSHQQWFLRVRSNSSYNSSFLGTYNCLLYLSYFVHSIQLVHYKLIWCQLLRRIKLSIFQLSNRNLPH